MKSFLSLFALLLFVTSLQSQPQLIDINPGGPGSHPEFFTEFSGEVYFRAHNPVSNQDVLFKTNGTNSGTHLVKDVAVAVDYPNNHFSTVNGKLIFSGYQLVIRLGTMDY